VYSVTKEEGLAQILFVTRDRFTEEEYEVLNILWKIIFDSGAIGYTAIVRTKSEKLMKLDDQKRDRIEIKEKNKRFDEVIELCNEELIYVNNPSVDVASEDDDSGDENQRKNKKQKEISRNLRKKVKTRQDLIVFLGKHHDREVYKPRSLVKVDKRIADYVSEGKRIEELREKSLKKEEIDILSKQLAEIKKEIAKLMEEMIKERELRMQAEERERKILQDRLQEQREMGIGQHLGIAAERAAEKLQAFIIQGNCLVM